MCVTSPSPRRIWSCLFQYSSATFGRSQASYIIFKQYEPRHHGQLITLLVVVPMLLAALVSLPCSTLQATFSTFVSYYFLLLFYTVAYRLSPLHPLAAYPGPVYARVSKWWSSYICADGKQHIYYKTLHDRFGDVVRVGESCCTVLRKDLTEKCIRRRP